MFSSIIYGDFISFFFVVVSFLPSFFLTRARDNDDVCACLLHKNEHPVKRKEGSMYKILFFVVRLGPNI